MIEVNVDKQFLQELTLATQKVLAQYKLQGSDLSKSVEYVYRNDQFVLLANDYFTYVSTGRRPRARKVPVEDIIKWMKDKGIAPKPNQTYNQVAYVITESIYRNGIKAKNYINPIVAVSEDLITEDLETTLANQIVEEITNDLTFSI